MVGSQSVGVSVGTMACYRLQLSSLPKKRRNGAIQVNLSGSTCLMTHWVEIHLRWLYGIGGADGGASPPIVIDSIVISPTTWMNWAEVSGKRWLNSQKCFPLMATLKQWLCAKISISMIWPRWTGHPPVRSSVPHAWFFRWLRTMTFWSGRMLKCKLMSSLGPSAGPVCTLIWMNRVSTCDMCARMRIITPCDRPPGILPKYGTAWNRKQRIRFCVKTHPNLFCPNINLLTGLYTGNVLIVRRISETKINHKNSIRKCSRKMTEISFRDDGRCDERGAQNTESYAIYRTTFLASKCAKIRNLMIPWKVLVEWVRRRYLIVILRLWR